MCRLGGVAINQDWYEVYSSPSVFDNRRTLWYIRNGQPIMHVVVGTFSQEQIDKEWLRLVEDDIKNGDR